MTEEQKRDIRRVVIGATIGAGLGAMAELMEVIIAGLCAGIAFGLALGKPTRFKRVIQFLCWVVDSIFVLYVSYVGITSRETFYIVVAVLLILAFVKLSTISKCFTKLKFNKIKR